MHERLTRPKNYVRTNRNDKNQARSSGLATADEDLIAIVLDKVPIQYAHVLATQQNIQGTNLTLSHLKEAMRNQYRIVKGRTDDDENMNEETGLGGIMGSNWRRKNRSDRNSETVKNKFKGICRHCGKKGHKKTTAFIWIKIKTNGPRVSK